MMFIAFILMTCGWLSAMAACFGYWKQWRKCQGALGLANIKIETAENKCKELQRRCVMLSFKCGERDNTIRRLHGHLEFHRTTR